MISKKKKKKKKKRSSPVNSTICVIFKREGGIFSQSSRRFFGDHPSFRHCFRIRTLVSAMKPATASHRPAFVGESIDMCTNLVKSDVFHRSKKRDLRTKKRDKASKSGTYGNPTYMIESFLIIECGGLIA